MPVAQPAVTAAEVVFKYGSRTAVARSSFSIPEGSITAIIGPNGSGKSTMLNGIAGLSEPIAGSIEVLPIDGRQRHVSYVLQTTKVNDSLPITVREVVTMGRYPSTGPYGWLKEADRTAVQAAMDRMEITDLAERHLTELSGGQRQRVFVAQGSHPGPRDAAPRRTSHRSRHHLGARHRRRHPRRAVTWLHDRSDYPRPDGGPGCGPRRPDVGRVVASGPPDEVLTEEHLRDAYGPSLIHVEGTRLFLDDPIHRPTDSRHEHQDRSIHLEVSPTEQHGGEDVPH